ncbi:MAG: Holliday junction resolvase RuvX [Myxococcales bacterium]|nr:Holliday junction resolvase RuvX [Myxococcales bacterium]
MPPETLRPPSPDERRKRKALALDIGRKRIGVAVLDVDTSMALADFVLQRKGTKSDIARLQERFDHIGAEIWVVGLPPTSPDPATCSARLARNFAKRLEACQPAPVWMVDEANTTREATDHLHLLGLSGRKLKAVIDMHAAARILDRWIAGEPAFSPDSAAE